MSAPTCGSEFATECRIVKEAWVKDSELVSCESHVMRFRTHGPVRILMAAPPADE